LLVRQAPFIHFQKEPLVPLVILGSVGGDLARPVVTDSESLHLATHVRNVLFGPIAWINAALDRCLFGRLAKTVPADRMQDVETLQTLVPGERIADGVVPHVAHVEEARRIRQHFETIKLWPRVVFSNLKRFSLLPILLPLAFYLFREIFFVHDYFSCRYLHLTRIICNANCWLAIVVVP